MNTSKPILSISFNTKPFLISKLNELVDSRHISFYAFIKHYAEPHECNDTAKDHFHVYVEPNPLTDEACKIISRIMQANDDNGQSDDNYLFVYNNHRVQTASVLKKIYSLCNELGFEQRSTHKIRKTVLSTMLNTCFKEDIADISAVRDFAGHVDENTLIKSYTFSTRKAETRDLAQKALNW